MHKIYFQNRSIVVCGKDGSALSDPNSVEFHMGEGFGIESLVDMFRLCSTIGRIVIPTSDEEGEPDLLSSN